MKNSRRIKRMGRAKRKGSAVLNLTSLMDVFTILVLYLLVNQSSVEVVEPPKDVQLPDSVAESKPRQTILMTVSPDQVAIQGEPLLRTDDVLTGDDDLVSPLKSRLESIKGSALGLNAGTEDRNNEITIMAHREVPFKILKELMTVCTSVGYTKISLAVNQKASQG
ncbi:biopolymer transporter ExbD [Proteobacteria bacterium 005FR1]|nr:biopolymer transporter ExbD [Proteobacteria bacterium 005FR1]